MTVSVSILILFALAVSVATIIGILIIRRLFTTAPAANHPSATATTNPSTTRTTQSSLNHQRRRLLILLNQRANKIAASEPLPNESTIYSHW